MRGRKRGGGDEVGDVSERECESVMVVGKRGVAAGNTVLAVLVQLLS